jgi:sugar transferase (PEP-CTERM/EpsH1 system associated)
MQIFFICRRVPFPPDRGDKIATFNVIRHLARQHEVHVFCLGDGAEDIANSSGLDDCAKSVTAVPVGGAAIRWRAAKALLTGEPLSVAALDETELHDAIKRKYDVLRPDLILVYSSNVAQFAEHFPLTPRVMQFGDLDSLKWGQYAGRSPIPLKWVYAAEERRLLAYERRIAKEFSASLVHTAQEQSDFERLIPGVPVALVGNGVDLDHFRSAGRVKEPGGIVFTGVMDYRPNVDAVQWFCDAVLPLVRAQIPQASFTICGNRPARPVRRLARRPGVLVTGRVPDTRPYLDRSQVFVAPLRMARGIQNKLLEALAMGLPCVASTAAWRGTALAHGDGIMASDAAEEFAGHVARLLRDGAYRAQMAAKARAAVEAHYRWETQLAPLDRIIDGLAPAPALQGAG